MTSPAGRSGALPGTSAPAPAAPVLSAADLVKVYPPASRAGQPTTALAGVSLDLAEGACLGVVGESGCGKSTLARLLIGLERPTAGTVLLQGQPVTSFRRPELARHMQLVWQDPFSSLNPRLTVASALTEVLLVHRRVPDKQQAAARVAELLDMVSLGPRFASRLPQEMSGGQAQRVAIARALAAEPQILILDEPTSALDVSVRAGIVNLLAGLRGELGLSYLFISHDMAVIRQLSDQIGVMYGGRFVERGPWQSVMSAPLHPYTRALLTAVPEPHPDDSLLGARDESAEEAPDADAAKQAVSTWTGCPYAPRCPIKIDRCLAEDPPLEIVTVAHEAACYRAGLLTDSGSAPADSGTVPGERS
jgi:oligopeptide/dipeptide ABC transporter ATP-binding protein